MITEPNDELIVVLDHPHGQLEISLAEWIETGPQGRGLLKPTELKKKSGESISLNKIPIKYRNNWLSKFLVQIKILSDPWKDS